MKHVSNLSRRAFLLRSAAVGGGLLLEVVLPNRGSAEAEQTPAAGEHGPEVTAWILVHPDDTITIRVARVEMGQGSFTGLPYAGRRRAGLRLEQGAGRVCVHQRTPETRAYFSHHGDRRQPVNPGQPRVPAPGRSCGPDDAH